MKKFLIQKYQDLILETAIEIDGVKYVRVVLEDYPVDDWYSHPYSGNTNFEDWQICTYLPLSPSGKVLYLPDIKELSGYDLESIVANGERMWVGDVLIPLFQYK